MIEYIGHTNPPGKRDYQSLTDHLLGVRHKALRHLAYCPPDVLEVAALGSICHDIGKACRGFKTYMQVCMYLAEDPTKWATIRRKMEGFGVPLPAVGPKESDVSWVPHDILGARVLLQYLSRTKTLGPDEVLRHYMPLLLLVAGHHRGWTYSIQTGKSKTEPLIRLQNELKRDAIPLAKGFKETYGVTGPTGNYCPKELSREKGVYDLTTFFLEHEKEAGDFLEALVRTHQLGFEPIINWVSWDGYVKHRAAMGALVGGDREDTAQFYGNFPSNRMPIKSLRAKVESTRARLQKRSEERGDAADVVTLRNLLYEASSAPRNKGGIIVMTGPTGSGKTLAALQVAVSLSARYIISVVPFLTLTDQLSRTIKNDVGIKALTHVSVPPIEEGKDKVSYMRRIEGITSPTTNWGHNFVITTTERLSRVLVGPGTSDNYRMTALLNPDMLVVLDEADQIPPGKLYSYLRVFERLPCTLLLTSATAHVIKQIMDRKNIRYEEVAKSLPLTRPLRKLEYRFWEDEERGLHTRRVELGREFLGQQALLIFNRIKFAAATYLTLKRQNPDSPIFYLSSRLSPVHRKAVLTKIQHRLKNNLPCLVLATTMVESGVDLDFPVVAREACSWASFLQAMGRCNRGGRLSHGRAILFGPKGSLDPGLFPGGPGDSLHEGDEDLNTLLVRAQILWDVLKAQDTLPGNEHEFEALGPCVIDAELDQLFRPDDVDADFSLKDGNMHPTTRYTLIPKDNQIQAVANYRGAHEQILGKDGQWSVGKLKVFVAHNSIQVRPIIKRGFDVKIMTDTHEIKDRQGKAHRVHFLKPEWYDIELDLGDWVTAGMAGPPKNRNLLTAPTHGGCVLTLP